MDQVTLGRTGLTASVVGLGCGGPSRLGQTYGLDESESVAVVQRALDLGITFLDTAEAYGTEPVVGKALAGRRHDVVVSTKAMTRRGGEPTSPEALQRAIEASLRRLATDHVDVYNFHGVRPQEYDHVVGNLLPVAQRLRDKGLIRHIGITEAFNADPGHTMLSRALQDDVWDVVMVGFNILNQSARERVFTSTAANSVGTLIMFAVRRALSQPDKLREVILRLKEQEAIGADVDPDDPFGFLVGGGGATSVTEAGYRFCRHEPGADVVLTGTGNVEHLEDNVRALLGPPLPEAHVSALRDMFAGLDHLTGN